MRLQRSLVLLIAVAVLLVLVADAHAQAQLPKKWGVGVSYYRQSQPYTLESLKLGLPGIDPAATEGLKVDNTTTTLHATFDYWLLPFLDVQLLVGNLESDTKVGLSKVNIGIPLSNLNVRAKGTVYGGGVTLAVGNERAFATLTGQYMETRLDEEDASVKAWVATPKLGMVLTPGIAAYIGAMYQKPQERHAGSYAVPPLGTTTYSVDLTSKKQWGYLAGVNIGLSEHWVATVEGGFSDRKSFLAHLDYRF
jgi:hypothetical protein